MISYFGVVISTFHTAWYSRNDQKIYCIRIFVLKNLFTVLKEHKKCLHMLDAHKHVQFCKAIHLCTKEINSIEMLHYYMFCVLDVPVR